MPDDTSNTLARYAAAFAKVAERWPDAPGLPDKYEMRRRFMVHWTSKYRCHPVPDAAALALCTVTAMEIGAWWERQEPVRRLFHVFYDAMHGWWQAHITTDCDDQTELDCGTQTAALACLAALEAIVSHD